VSGKPRLLAVDDEQRGIELVARVLRKIGTVDLAMSGEEGWQLFQVAPYDVVISDQRMPGMSGVELLTLVADRAPHTGRILLTGYTDFAATVDAINKGRIHAYLNKPCPPDQLRMMTSSVAEQVRLQKLNESLIQELSGRNDELEEVLASLRLEQKSMVEAARTSTAREIGEAFAERAANLLETLARLASQLAESASLHEARQVASSLRELADAPPLALPASLMPAEKKN